MRRLVFGLALSTFVATGATRATAQDAPPSDGATAAPETAPDVGPERAAGAASPAQPGPTVIQIHTDTDPREEPRPQQSYFDPHELEGESYHHLGVFARGIIAPKFIQNLFVNGGLNAMNLGVGGFYNYRRDGLNIIVEVWRAGFYGTAPFYGLNERPDAIELIESELSVVFGNIVLMWSIPLASFLAIEIGLGLGFGGVFGTLWRTEAYPDGDSWAACLDAGAPDPTYCDPREANGGDGHYQRLDGTPEEYNFSGGVPPLWFWVDLPRVAIRIKPLRQLQIRVEGGFAAYAFHAGASLAFGF